MSLAATMFTMGALPHTYPDLQAADRLTLIYLADSYDDDSNAAWPEIDWLAREMSVSVRTLRASLDRLIARGVLTAQPYYDEFGQSGTRWTMTGYDRWMDRAGIARDPEMAR